MAAVKLTLDGTLEVQRTTGSVCSTSESPSPFDLDLNASSKLFEAGSSIEQRSMSIDSSGSFVSLPLPSTLRVRVFYLRIRTGGPLSVEITYGSTGVVVHPGVKGVFLVDLDYTEQASAIRLKGIASDYEWVAAGVLV